MSAASKMIDLLSKAAEIFRTDPARNGPYGGSLRVLRWPGAVTSYKRFDEIDESMRRITPEEVFESLRAALESAHGDSGCSNR